MNYQVHLAIQIVPISKSHPYPLIDKAIEVIERSGVEYTVGAMETVMQGKYDELMQISKQAQQACLDAGADEVVVTLKVHARKNGDVTWDEKLEKIHVMMHWCDQLLMVQKKKSTKRITKNLKFSVSGISCFGRLVKNRGGTKKICNSLQR